MKRAYKFVPAEYSASFARGELRIGTLYDYKDVEGRADPEENSTSLYIDNMVIADTRTDHEKVAQAAAVSISLENCQNVTIRNAGRLVRGPNLYCFCMSKTRTATTPYQQKSEQCLFEIIDYESLAWQIVNSQDFADSYRISDVTYGSRTQDVTQGSWSLNTDPFLKSPFFACEDEVRIVFSPRVSLLTIEAFTTAPSAGIASLIRKIT